MSNEPEQNDATNGVLTSPEPLPSWVEAPLFEPIFREIYADFKQTKVFEAKPALSAGENYATVMLRLVAEVELNNGTSKNISLMLKTAHDNDTFREIMKSHNLFEVETDVYREVVPELEELYREAGVKVKFGAQAYELATEQPYILLEDLSVRGFKIMNRVEGLDREHTQAVLTKLAQWHAASAVRVATRGPYKSTLRNGNVHEGCREMMKSVLDGMLKICLQCAKSYEGTEKYYDAMCSATINVVDDLVRTTDEEANGFCVLNHGDCWSNNVMFQHDAYGKIKETYLLDYQIPRYGSPAQDLYYILLASTNFELKLKHFDYFIKYYYDRLAEHLKLLNYPKKAPALKDIHIMLLKHSIWAFITVTGVMGAVLLDPNDNASTENYFAENDVGQLFKMQVYSNPRYRKHMELILPWLYNRGGF